MPRAEEWMEKKAHTLCKLLGGLSSFPPCTKVTQILFPWRKVLQRILNKLIPYVEHNSNFIVLKTWRGISQFYSRNVCDVFNEKWKAFSFLFRYYGRVFFSCFFDMHVTRRLYKSYQNVNTSTETFPFLTCCIGSVSILLLKYLLGQQQDQQHSYWTWKMFPQTKCFRKKINQNFAKNLNQNFVQDVCVCVCYMKSFYPFSE